MKQSGVEVRITYIDGGLKMYVESDSSTIEVLGVLRLAEASLLRNQDRGVVDDAEADMRKAIREAKDDAPQPGMKVAFIPHIKEWREVRNCPDCGKPTYCLDPGDGLATHIVEGDGIEVRDVDTGETV